jgi:hypothetical protein
MAALRKLPYIPLYVNDFSCDEKLRMCSASAVGVYIFLMCVLHKSATYGVLTLQHFRKHNKTDNKTDNKTITTSESLLYDFSELLRRQTPFSVEEIKDALEELVFYKVVVIEGETLYQPRMKKDGEKSEKRGKAGKAGMKNRWNIEEENGEGEEKTITKNITKHITNSITNALQNTENENENVYINNNTIEGEEKGVKGKKKQAFEPPTLEEVMKYCEERGTGIDPISFFDFYEANGWVQGKQGKPLKDWKAAVRYWERNGVTTTNNRNDGRQQATGTGTAAKAATGGYSEVRGDTTAKKTRHSTI